MRVGIGYDIHLLVEGRELILGGIKVDYKLGLLGHSDGDVLLHTICDAILGALGEGDIGLHFQDTDSRYKDISSVFFIKEVCKLLDIRGYKINNLDTVIVADEPRLINYSPKIHKNISRLLNIEDNQVNLKIKSQEGLSYNNKYKYIYAYAVVSIIER